MECLSSDNLEAILNRGEFSGLSIIITNDYHTTLSYNHLTGTSKDGDQLSAAFRHMSFCVKRYTNVNLSTLQLILGEIRSLKWDIVKGYSCIAILFAGHGTQGDELVLQDGALVDPYEIIKQLLPGSCPHLGVVPKVFLIDACRGSGITETVSIPVVRGSATSARGGKLLDQCLVPKEGNFLIARSTLHNYKAYESREIGGIWFHTLADYMLKMEEKMSLEDILTDVNGRIVEKQLNKSQQPEKLSRLNKIVHLQPSNHTSYCSLLKSYLAYNNGRAQYEVLPHVGDINTYYQGVVTLTFYVQQQEVFQQYATHESYLIIDQAYEEAAKIAYISIIENVCHTNGPQCGAATNTGATLLDSVNIPANILSSSAGSSSHSSCETATSAAPPEISKPATKPAWNYRSKFHEYCQKEEIQPQFEFDENESETAKRFKCTILFNKNGQLVRVDSQDFYPKKDDAKEAACRNMLGIQSRGEASGSGSWKSQLKEYYDKRGEPNKVFNYQTTQVKNSKPPQFISSIYIRELKTEVQGMVCKSKKDAEQSAAQKALAKICSHSQ